MSESDDKKPPPESTTGQKVVAAGMLAYVKVMRGIGRVFGIKSLQGGPTNPSAGPPPPEVPSPDRKK